MYPTIARIQPFVVGLAFVVSAETSAFAQDTVTSCGQTISRSATLANDLDCTGMAPAVTIRLGATLTLGGFSISGATITCDANCVIQGPGTIAGAGGGSIVARSITSNGYLFASRELTLVGSIVNGYAHGLDRAYVEDSTIDGNGTNQVGVQTQRLTMIDSTVINHTQWGVYCHFGKVLGSTVRDNTDVGVNCAKLTMENSELTGNGYAVRGYSVVKIAGTQITGNYHGVSGADRLRMTDSVVDGNAGNGVDSGRTTLSGSSVTNNGCVGAWGTYKLRLETTDVTGNGTDVDCERRADVFSINTPILKDGASCETSLGSGTNNNETWNICSLD